MKQGIYVKKTRKGWAWNLVAKNGKIVANGESFKQIAGAKKGLTATITAIQDILKTGGNWAWVPVDKNIFQFRSEEKPSTPVAAPSQEEAPQESVS